MFGSSAESIVGRFRHGYQGSGFGHESYIKAASSPCIDRSTIPDALSARHAASPVAVDVDDFDGVDGVGILRSSAGERAQSLGLCQCNRLVELMAKSGYEANALLPSISSPCSSLHPQRQFEPQSSDVRVVAKTRPPHCASSTGHGAC